MEDEIRKQRGRPREPGTKKGRSPTELKMLARAARRQWELKEAEGRVGFLDR